MNVPKEKFIVVNGQVISVYDLNEDYFVIASEIFDAKKYTVYDDRMDALYAKLVKDLTKGKPLENFRTSKYYKYYIDRLKKENPEFII